MGLTTGQRLGPYAVVAPLGAGGMGEVYRATDTKLGRDVAIKVLPADFARDADRIARFEREARLLASLNHPNVAHVYGFENAALDDGARVHFLAMELVEGEDLAFRLKRGPVPVDEAVAIAKQIAEALEEAHERGIVHRDLKPANVRLTPDGKVKVLDFGLAKAYAGDREDSKPDLSRSPTITRQGTEAGLILGTAAYMSPEQARGKPVDKRADIWAFGVVLYEMLTGRPLFTGETASDVLAGVLRTEIDLDHLPASVPPGVRGLVRRCLERDPKQRLRDIGDARLELAAGAAQPAGIGPVAPAPAGAQRLLRGVAGLFLVAAVAFAAGRWRGQSPLPGPSPRDLAFAVRPDGAGPAVITELDLSRDGQRLVFRSSGNRSLLLREMGDVRTRPIPGTEGAEHPFLSPDGKWLGFFAGGKIKKVAFAGGDPVSICDGPESGPGAAWGLDGSIYFTPTFTSGLFRVDAGGGAPVPLTTPDLSRGETGHSWPDPLPGGTGLIFTIFGGSGMNDSRVALLDLRSGKQEVLLEGAGARYVASGHLFFYRRGAHYAVPFDPATRKVGGPARAVLRNVRRPDPTGERLPLAFSDGGQVAYVPGEAPYNARATRLVWISRDGTEEPLPFEGIHVLASLSLSPDGRRAAVTRYADGETQIWAYDLARGTQEPLTREGVNQSPTWHPDGSHVGYTTLTSGNYDLWQAAIDGSVAPSSLVTGDRDESDMQWSVDGRHMIFQVYSEQTGPDLMLLSLDAPERRQSLVATPLDDSDHRLSRDGKWLAYSSGDALYVSAFPGMGARTLIGRNAHTPRWSGATRELFFIQGGELMAARHAVRDDRSFEVEAPRALFKPPPLPAGRLRFEVAADGQRFLFFAPLPGRAASDEIHVLLRGFEALQGAPGEEP